MPLDEEWDVEHAEHAEHAAAGMVATCGMDKWAVESSGDDKNRLNMIQDTRRTAVR